MEPNIVPMRPFQPLLASHKAALLWFHAARSRLKRLFMFQTLDTYEDMLRQLTTSREQNKCLLVVVVKKQTKQTVG